MAGPSLAFPQFRQRQVGDDAGAALARVDDHLFRVFENFLHPFQEQSPDGYFLGHFIGLINRKEPLGLAVRLLDDFFLIGRCPLDHGLGHALGLGDDVVLIGLGLVDGAFLVLTRPLHVVEGVDDLGRRVGLLELDLGDDDAGAVVIENLLQQILDVYGAGVSIVEVQLQKADPPAQVIDAFHDVQRARQDQERSVNEALTYKNDIVPKAKGKAQTMIQAAIAYKVKVTKEAEGEAKRFLSVYETYKGAKEVTIRRLFLERMQEVFKKSEKVIIDKGQGGTGVVPYLALPELRKRQGGASQ